MSEKDKEKILKDYIEYNIYLILKKYNFNENINYIPKKVLEEEFKSKEILYKIKKPYLKNIKNHYIYKNIIKNKFKEIKI